MESPSRPPGPLERRTIEYFHIVLDTHEVVLAEGIPAEKLPHHGT